MIRIDENTYIDDTLVTCAEYQLFIDEMREQGKYYQPDHWASYQFPEGQAREPILGTRHFDAVTFCGWLTQRDGKDWRYRLLTSAEAKVHPLKPKQTLFPFGYWINNNEDYFRFVLEGFDVQSQFAWIGSIPDNPRILDLDRTLDLDNIYNRNINRAHNRVGFIKRILSHDRDIDGNINRTLESLREIDRFFAIGPVLDRSRNLDRAFDQNVFDPKRTSSPNLNIDIATLQERIAGRSPAFEGIRLVKERKKS
jgi:hypothetical protein